MTRRYRRAGQVIAAIAFVATLTAGCGGGGGGDDSADSGTSGDAAFLKFTKCMRDEGIDMPDPEQSSDGAVVVGRGSINPNDADFKAAEAKCKKHLGDAMNAGGDGPSADTQDRLLKMAQCMRSKGIDIPDPAPGGGPTLGPAPKDDDPAFAEAQRACSREVGLPDAGVQR